MLILKLKKKKKITPCSQGFAFVFSSSVVYLHVWYKEGIYLYFIFSYGGPSLIYWIVYSSPTEFFKIEIHLTYNIMQV